MAAISSLTDEEIDELLAGHAPASQRDLAPLAEVASALRERTAEEPVPVMRYPLRHAVTRRAALVELPRSRRLVHVAVGGAAIALVGLAGAANALPAPVQDAVAEVGDLVGVEVPHADEDTSLDAPGADGRPAPTVASDADDQGVDVGVPPPDSTSGGVAPAEPGTAGDEAEATPAIPPGPEVDEHSGDANPNAPEQADHGAQDASDAADHDDPTDAADESSDDEPDDDGEAQRIVDDRADPRVPTGANRINVT